MSKKSNQVDKEGYLEGYRTGLNKGYKKGIADGLVIMQKILEENGMFIKDSEFYLEMNNLMEEGELTPPDTK